MQVMVVFFVVTGLAVGVAEGVGATVTCVSFTLTVGDENVNPYAPR